MKRKLTKALVESTMMLSHVLALGRAQAGECETLRKERNGAWERQRELEVVASEVRSGKGQDLATIQARDEAITALRGERVEACRKLNILTLGHQGRCDLPACVERVVEKVRELRDERDQAAQGGQAAARELASERTALVEAYRLLDGLLKDPGGELKQRAAHQWLALYEVRERQRRAKIPTQEGG